MPSYPTRKEGPKMATVPDPKKPVKAVVAAIGLAATWVTASLADGDISTQEWWAGVIGLIVTVGAVYGFKNPQIEETP
jgi:hypothetical protein